MTTMESKYEEKFTSIENQIEEIVPIRLEIDCLQREVKEKRQETMQEKIQVIVQQACQPMENMKRFNEDVRDNPKIFIKNVEKAVSTNLPGDLKGYLRSMLGGDAELWFDIVAEDFENIEEFQEMFIKHFWSDEIQRKQKENIYYGSYRENMGVTRESNAMRRFILAKQLDPPMSDKEIIKLLARHFEEDVRHHIIATEIDNVDRFLEYIR